MVYQPFNKNVQLLSLFNIYRESAVVNEALYLYLFFYFHQITNIKHQKVMNIKTTFLCAVVAVLSMPLSGQNGKGGTPPEVSPMPMKPQMTEIWEPEVGVVVPGKKLGDAPSDAIILFDGTNLDQWTSQKDNSKQAPWKIVDNDHMEVVPGTGGINLATARYIWNSVPRMWLRVRVRVGETVAFFYRIGMNCKYWTPITTEPTVTDRQPVFIKTRHPW